VEELVTFKFKLLKKHSLHQAEALLEADRRSTKQAITAFWSPSWARRTVQPPSTPYLISVSVRCSLLFSMTENTSWVRPVRLSVACFSGTYRAAIYQWPYELFALPTTSSHVNYFLSRQFDDVNDNDCWMIMAIIIIIEWLFIDYYLMIIKM
jgi:hypothetical protein